MKKFLAVLMMAAAGMSLCGADVAICGAGYGRYEINQITDNVLKRKDVKFTFENIGEFPDYAKYKDSKLLIIATNSKKKFTAGDMEQFKAWVNNGGKVLIMNRAINALAPAKDWKWSGFGWVARRQYEAQLLDKDNPIVKDIKFTAFPDALSIQVTAPAKTVIGSGNIALIAESTVGKGKLYLMANEYFRMKAKNWNHPFQKEYLKIIQNIVDINVAK